MTADLRYLSYVRRGLARSIGDQADSSGIPRSAVASVDVAVVAAGEEKPHTMAVRGPGSVVGLAPGEVVRVDPPDGATDHAANMFASVELRTADLPWLFTPARPRGERLIPWLVLVVVEDREGNSLTADGSGLSVLSVGDAARELPDLNEAWAWAHAQVDAEYTDLAALLDDTPELACARLLCPRLLEPDSGYFACVVPSFEAGRLAGLGLTAPADSVELAWAHERVDVRLPVLHSWSFRTAPEPADFEELVRRLDPQPFGPDVGVHDLDLSDPGSTRLPSSQVTVGYEGALGSPEMRAPPWRDPHARSSAPQWACCSRTPPPASRAPRASPTWRLATTPWWRRLATAPCRPGSTTSRSPVRAPARRRRAGSRRRTSTRSTARRRAWEPRWFGSTRRR